MEAAGLPLKRDVRGNRDNLRYGSLERSTIPKYRLRGYGHVIGLGRDYKILKSSDTHREIIAKGSDSSRRQKRDSLSSSIALAGPRPIKIVVTHEDAVRKQANYISLNGSSKRRRLSDEERHPFSILQNEGPESEDDDSAENGDAASADKTNAWETFRNDIVQQRHRELMKQTSNDPQNLEAWLDLVGQQEALVKASGVSENGKLTGAQRQTVVSMRISIYEQALSKISHAGARQRLIAGFMREGSKIWDHQKQQTEWQRLLGENASQGLKRLHLNFLMSSHHAFSFEKVLGVAVQYLHEGWQQPPTDRKYEEVILLLLRITTYLKEGGYTERAFALWQAYLEIAFFKPGISAEASKSSFEDFWDSECPRVGEPGAVGWATSQTSPVNASNTAAEAVADEHNADFTTWSSWSRAEVRSQSNCVLRAKSLEDTKDPFRVVLFPDIEQLLFFDFPTDMKHEFIGGFLQFCGLSALTSASSAHQEELDPFLYQYQATTGCEPSRTHLPAPGDLLSLFADHEQHYHTFTVSNGQSTYVTLARRAISQLLAASSNNDDLAEYALALEVACNRDAARKFAKKLIKQRGNSLRLYNAYALVEARVNGLGAAEKVWTAVLSSQAKEGDKERSDRLLLLRTWAWTGTTVHESAEALVVIARLEQPALQMGSRPSPSVSELASAERHLWSYLSRAHSEGKLNDLVNITDLLALLSYHASNSDLASALDVYHNVLSLCTFKHTPEEMLQSTRNALQQLHTNRNRLIDIHTASSAVEFRPKQIIDLLKSSCQIFPNNLAFRRHLNDFSQKHGGIDRLRSALSTESSPTTHHSQATLIDHLSAINAALHLPLHHGGTQHTVRSAFHHALLPTLTHADTPSSIRCCPAINIAFLHGELRLLRDLTSFDSAGARIPPQQTSKREEKARKKQVQNVKAAFQTAVTNCPWVKEVYLLYFDELLEYDVEEREWAEVYDSMLERGLRICVER